MSSNVARREYISSKIIEAFNSGEKYLSADRIAELILPDKSIMFGGLIEDIMNDLPKIRDELEGSDIRCALLCEGFFNCHMEVKINRPDFDDYRSGLAGGNGRCAYGLSNDPRLYMAWINKNMSTATPKIRKNIERSSESYVKGEIDITSLDDTVGRIIDHSRPRNAKDLIETIKDREGEGYKLLNNPIIKNPEDKEDEL